jgi:dipeptidyl-peptidase III
MLALAIATGCNKTATTPEPGTGTDSTASEFQWQTEQFADIRILRYQVPGFDELPLQQKEMLYYLSEAATSGRDMIYDQNFKHNLVIRRTLENVLKTYSGEKTGQDWDAFTVYLKRIWFSNGIHHHYSTKKIEPGFPAEYFDLLVRNSDPKGLPLAEGETLDQLINKLKPILFDPAVFPKRVNLDQGVDNIANSANNYYEGVTQAEVEAYYKKLVNPADTTPISYGLNSKMVKEGGKLVEKTWKVGGMYSPAIEKVVFWLEKAVGVAENESQKKTLELLVKYYKSGDLKDFDAYSIAWVQDTQSDIDFINGFIETYGDALSLRAAFESVVQIKDPEASKRIEAISQSAQWFEDNSSILPEHKKENVKGISARVINVVMEAGDASPSTPVGINLPNARWIRKDYGSKSVNLANIVQAYDEANKSGGMLEEFANSKEEIELSKKHGRLAGNLHTDMHEAIGHASGKLEPGVSPDALKTYTSCLEEARADLVALYYITDQKLVDIGVMSTTDVGKCEFNDYLRNGLMLQLRRLELGDQLEEAHMRNRALVCRWVLEKGADKKVVEMIKREGKTYVQINDYAALRVLFGDLLREIQRIISQGDYEAGKALVENYGVKVDRALHEEILQRVEKLNIAPYAGFINPVLVPVKDANGKITDVKIEYPDDFTKQHLNYGEKYSFLPHYN